MKQITIDCANIQSPQALHGALREALSFPAWYGNNLDALHDCLTGMQEATELTLENFMGLGSFAAGFLRVFTDATQENPRLQITIL